MVFVKCLNNAIHGVEFTSHFKVNHLFQLSSIVVLLAHVVHYIVDVIGFEREVLDEAVLTLVLVDHGSHRISIEGI